VQARWVRVELPRLHQVFSTGIASPSLGRRSGGQSIICGTRLTESRVSPDQTAEVLDVVEGRAARGVPNLDVWG